VKREEDNKSATTFHTQPLHCTLDEIPQLLKLQFFIACIFGQKNVNDNFLLAKIAISPPFSFLVEFISLQ